MVTPSRTFSSQDLISLAKIHQRLTSGYTTGDEILSYDEILYMYRNLCRENHPLAKDAQDCLLIMNDQRTY